MSTKPSIIELTYQKKPEERFLISAVNTTSVNGKEVVLLVTLEINDVWHPARVGGTELINAFNRFFSRSTHQSLLTKFEDTLKSCNGLIDNLFENINSPVNCAAVALSGTEVYLSTMGTTKVLLHRAGRVTPVSARHQELVDKQFSTVTVGEVNPGDWLILANHDLTDELLELKTDFPEEPETLIELVKELSAKSDERKFGGLLVNVAPEITIQRTVQLDNVDNKVPVSLPTITLPRIDKIELAQKLKGFWELWQKHRPKHPPQLPSLNTKRVLRTKLLLPIIIGLLIIFAAVISVKSLRANRNTAPLPTNALVQAIETKNKATILLELTKANFETLTSEQLKQLTSVLAISSIQLLPSANVEHHFESSITSLTSSGEAVFALDANGQIWQITNQPALIDSQKSISKPKQLVAVSSDKLLVTTTDNKILLIEISKRAQTLLKQPAQIANKPTLLSPYAGNLYLFATSENILYKVTDFQTSLAKVFKYTSAGVVKNKEVSGLAINGQIFTVSTSGSIDQFLRNRLLKHLAGSDQEGLHCLALTSTKLFVSNANLLISYDLTDFSREKLSYRLINDQVITSLTISKNRLLVAAGQDLYSIAIN